MERGRKTKVITIIGLVVAIVTMSLGFAVFSNVLTISSSATVKPNAEDYVVTIYGVEGIPEDVTVSEVDELFPYMTSKTAGAPILSGAFDASPAVIDNRNFTISNLNVIFSGGSQGVGYVFLIKNEGKKDIYINLDTVVSVSNKTCLANGETTQALVDEDCLKVGFLLTLLDSTGAPVETSESSYKIVPNDFVVLGGIFMSNNEFVADGEFTVNFEDIQIEFSSLDNSQSS